MDSRDPSGAVSRLVLLLRRLTRVVQLAPFVYLLLLALYLLLEPVMPDWALRLTDNLLNAPVYAVAGMLGIGRMLKLCKWFRAACLLPVTTKVESYVDSFLFAFTENEVLIINVALGLLFITFIYLSFRHFFHGRTETKPF